MSREPKPELMDQVCGIRIEGLEDLVKIGLVKLRAKTRRVRTKPDMTDKVYTYRYWEVIKDSGRPVARIKIDDEGNIVLPKWARYWGEEYKERVETQLKRSYHAWSALVAASELTELAKRALQLLEEMRKHCEEYKKLMEKGHFNPWLDVIDEPLTSSAS